jgi:hypothetical protein
VVGAAARLPNSPGTQNEIPLSSALAICGEKARVANAIAPSRAGHEGRENSNVSFICGSPGFSQSHTFQLETKADRKIDGIRIRLLCK